MRFVAFGCCEGSIGKMNYLYHSVPKDLKGDYLMPLNELKKEHPKIYKKILKEYSDRKNLLKAKIPCLNCLWNEVIHLTSTNPWELKKAFINAGGKDWNRNKFFKINPKLLDKSKAVIYQSSNTGIRIFKKDFMEFSLKNIKKLNKVPEKTKRHFRDSLRRNEYSFAFAYTPHILYKGRLKIKDLKIIKI